MSSLNDDISQLAHDLGVADVARIALPTITKQDPKKKQEKEEAEAARKAKKAARDAIIPIADPESRRTSRRKEQARKKAGGRLSTILSDQRETLG